MLSKSQLKELHGKEYVESFEKGQSKFRLERLIHSIPLNADCKVADFGCGSGMLLPLLADRVAHYTGIDFSEAFIQAAEKRKRLLNATNAEFVCEDIIKFCRENSGTFDIAFAMDFSEHVYDDDWLNILRAINQSLKEGGKLYLHTPNADFVVETMKKRNFIVKQFPEHIAVRSVRENIALLEQADFEV